MPEEKMIYRQGESVYLVGWDRDVGRSRWVNFPVSHVAIDHNCQKTNNFHGLDFLLDNPP